MDASCTRVYLLRHGETANYRGEFVYNGHIDVDVTERGRMQLLSQAGLLGKRPLKAVYTSDLKRAVQGARAVASTLDLDVVRDPRLREIAAGRWEGLTYKEVSERYPEEARVRFDDIVNYRIGEGGENLLDVRERASEAMGEIIEKHRGEEVAVVAHGGINRIILCEAMGLGLENLLRIEQDFGCINIIDYYDDTAVVKLLNLRPGCLC